MSNAELIERLNKPCGRTTGHGESCSVGWLCGACADKAKAADALELADKRIAELERNEGGGCTLAGPGRGDCEHYVGLQDGAVDAYGKPNGWCWSCWKSKRIAELEEAASFNFEQYQDAASLLCEANQRIAELEAELKQRAKQIGVACTKHDLTHSLACGRCLAEAELLLKASVKRGGELIGEKQEAERKLAVALEAMQNLVAVKGRYHTEQAYNRIVEALAQIGGEE